MPGRIVMRTGEALVEGDKGHLCADAHHTPRTSALVPAPETTPYSRTSPGTGSNTSRDRSLPPTLFRSLFGSCR
jgi:hypothetical protein